MTAQQSYLICATQRTGSTLLCETLRKSERAGIPREYFEYLTETGLPRQPTQYFIPAEETGCSAARIAELLGSPKLRMDLERIRYQQRHGVQYYLGRVLDHGTTRNGIFGAKIMWDHLPDLLDQLTGNADVTASQRVNVCLQEIFPRLKYIYVTRQDKMRQAISLWKAIQTQQWRLDRDSRKAKEWRVPVFDFGAVEYLHRRMIEHDRDWQKFFANAQIEPLVLRYEEFANDLKATFMRIARFLGLNEKLDRHFALPSMIEQSNSQSEHWIEQYRATSEANSRRHVTVY